MRRHFVALHTCGAAASGWLVLGLGLLVGTAVVAPASAVGALVVNEVLYDPQGPDPGFEWVEIYNSGPWAATCEGLSLESGNGAAPGRWTEVWKGSPGEWIEAGAAFRVGGPYRGRDADSPAALMLGNAPDGVRLLREGLELDRVGWGDLTYPEYYEGEPAPDVSSGSSLARRVDGWDTDDNRRDFEEAAPTPSRPNHPAVDLGVRLQRAGRPVPLAGTTGQIEAILCLENRGTGEVDPARIAAIVDGRTLLPDPSRLGAPLAAGAAAFLPLLLDIRPGGGERSWSCLVRMDGDRIPENDADTLRLWAGPSPLGFSEIAPHPEPGGTEWIELALRSEQGVELAGWSLADRSGSTIRLRQAQGWRGRYAVVARDSSAMGALPEGVLLSWSGSWPSLNDAAGADGSADSLFLYDPTGLLVDWAAYGGTPRGEAWVRLDTMAWGLDGWSLSSTVPGGVRGGSPGRANPGTGSSSSLDTGRLSAPALSFSREAGGLWFHIPADLLPGSWRLRLLDMAGRVIWTREGAARDRVEQCCRWDGRGTGGVPCPQGVYLAHLAVVDAEGRAQGIRQPLVLAP